MLKALNLPLVQSFAKVLSEFESWLEAEGSREKEKVGDALDDALACVAIRSRYLVRFGKGNLMQRPIADAIPISPPCASWSCFIATVRLIFLAGNRLDRVAPVAIARSPQK